MRTANLDRHPHTLRSLGEGAGDRAAKAQRAVDLIRTLGPYRWAGLYDVLATEIAAIAWCIGGTRGEMLQPVVDESGAVIGTIDVESERVNAFTDRDEELLALCAENLSWLWRANG